MNKVSDDLDNPIPIVTKQQMIDYIFAQPDERRVNFSQNYFHNDCGCVMVHYGKDNGVKFHGCGFQAWEGFRGGKQLQLEDDVTFMSFCPKGESDQYTYGDIKEFLRQKDWLPANLRLAESLQGQASTGETSDA